MDNKVDASQEEQGNQQENFDPEQAVEQFDVTRKARTDALEQIEKMLTRATNGFNMDKKDTLKCLRQFYVICLMQDMLLKALMADLVRGIQSMAKGEVDLFNLTAKVFTITQALYSKDLVSQDELEKIHQEVTVPKLLAQFKDNNNEGEEVKED